MNIKKDKAIKLRKKGRSYNEIKRLIGVSKGTLSYWLGGIKLSAKSEQRIKKRIFAGSLKGLIKRNKKQTFLARQRMFAIRKASRKEIKKISKRELKLIGIALYWAEGYKRLQVRNGRERTYHPVAVANSDPRLAGLFIRFLKDICGVPIKEIKAELRIFKHMNGARTLAYWQKQTKLPKKNFGKIYYGVSVSSLGKRPYNRLPFGTISIRVNDTKLFHKIMGWIEGLSALS